MRATSGTNRSAKGGARSSPHYGGEGVLIHPPHQGVCGRHGTEDQGVTPGELPGSSGGTEGSDSISASETRSGALEVVGRLGSTGGERTSIVSVAPPCQRICSQSNFGSGLLRTVISRISKRRMRLRSRAAVVEAVHSRGKSLASCRICRFWSAVTVRSC